MNIKDMKDSEQIQYEIEYWERVAINNGSVDNGNMIGDLPPLCNEHTGACGEWCPLGKFCGGPCGDWIRFFRWDDDMTTENAQVIVGILKDIKHKLFRLDR